MNRLTPLALALLVLAGCGDDGFSCPNSASLAGAYEVTFTRVEDCTGRIPNLEGTVLVETFEDPARVSPDDPGCMTIARTFEADACFFREATRCDASVDPEEADEIFEVQWTSATTIEGEFLFTPAVGPNAGCTVRADFVGERL